jgi:uncharacterized protein YndB with AHSA1/START domain/ketosteroid isomerase-like protein
MTAPGPASRHGVVERHGTAGTIRFERLLAYPLERVWTALTTPEGLGAWWLPFPAKISIDLVVGGALSFHAPELGSGTTTCEILELDPPKRLVHRHFDPTITLVWDLHAEDDACRLRLTQYTPDITAALAQGHVVGLHLSLDRLEPALAGTPEPWDWDRMPVLEQEYRARLGDAVPSPHQQVLDRYMDGFRTGDHDAIHACLTDDVTWNIVGHARAADRAEFDALIDGPEGASLPRLTIDRCVQTQDVIVAFGEGQFDGPDGALHAFDFVDAFTFRDGLISELASYVVPTGPFIGSAPRSVVQQGSSHDTP